MPSVAAVTDFRAVYVKDEIDLNKRNIKEFKSSLISLGDLVKSNPKDGRIKNNFATSLQAVDEAISALPATERTRPAFILQVMNGLLDAANSEYKAAVANGKITAAVEYQDSRGFVIYSHELYESISTQITQVNPQANQAIEKSFAELLKVWPSVIAPPQAIKTPEDVTKLIKTIEENSQKVIEVTNTKAQS